MLPSLDVIAIFRDFKFNRPVSFVNHCNNYQRPCTTNSGRCTPRVSRQFRRLTSIGRTQARVTAATLLCHIHSRSNATRRMAVSCEESALTLPAAPGPDRPTYKAGARAADGGGTGRKWEILELIRIQNTFMSRHLRDICAPLHGVFMAAMQWLHMKQRPVQTPHRTPTPRPPPRSQPLTERRWLAGRRTMYRPPMGLTRLPGRGQLRMTAPIRPAPGGSAGPITGAPPVPGCRGV